MIGAFLMALLTLIGKLILWFGVGLFISELVKLAGRD